MNLGALAILNPWLLAALAALPLIYWLLRAVPPRPQQVEFPPTRILVGIENREKTPAKTPWWLTLIRLLAAALVIFALSDPILNPAQEQTLKGTGPVVIVVDNGWAAASHWNDRQNMIEQLISSAEGQQRPVVIVPTARGSKAIALKVEAPNDARSSAAALTPLPFAPDRLAAEAALEKALQTQNSGAPSIVWLRDGIDHDEKGSEFGDKLAALAENGSFAVIDDTPGTEALGLKAGVGRGGKLEASVLRTGGPARAGQILAFSARGQRLGEANYQIGNGATKSDVVFDLPLELRNQVVRVEIAGERAAGSVNLLDARSQWQRVGLISGETREQAQPLLAPHYYVQKALAPTAEIIRPKDSNLAIGIENVLANNATVLVLADIGTLSGAVKERVEQWVEKGGVLVRFAGPRLEKGGDDLLPVPLRLGGRTLGGALSWSEPQPLAPFEDTSLFAGLDVPPDVTVNRQVLADPAQLGPDVSVWARLKDGTPLVTSARRGDGQIVLFHVTANSDWSNLPISGLFVDMLSRITALGRLGAPGPEANAAADTSGKIEKKEEANGGDRASSVLPPVQTLDGFGDLKPPPPTAQPVALADLGKIVPSLDHPPGYYGSMATPRAVNVLGPKSTLTPLPSLPASAEKRGYQSETATPLKPWLLAAALALLFIDIVAVVLLQAGGLGRLIRRPAARAASVVLLAGLALAAAPGVGFAQEPPPAAPNSPQAKTRQPGQPPVYATKRDDAKAQQATSKVTFGYVLTGDGETDNVTRLGLSGLARVLAARTAVEPGEPLPININTDELAFYPILYWPVLPNAPALPEPTLAKIDAYMKEGGLIIFDTRDYGQGVPEGLPMTSPGGAALQRILGKLDIPRLEPVPENHVLTKSFYLLRTFPGRWDGGQLWVESTDDENDGGRRARVADGVTSIMITSNDFAAAWALDESGRPLYPTVPGGENQREMSFRAGINIVMHALTGNYKSDQVHVPALLERLGQ
jgi:hypothetical protein